MAGDFPLLRYSVRRILQAVPLIFWVIIINFTIIHLAPGDPAIYLASVTEATPEAYAELRKEFGLDKPLYVQMGIYLWKLLHLDLGYSTWHNSPVLGVILDRLPATMLLMATAFSIASLMGVVLGVIASRYSYSVGDHLATLASLAGYSMPIFWLGQLLILFFALYLDWLPSQGMYSMRGVEPGWPAVLDVLKHLLLPAITYATYHMTLVFRITRGKMQETLAQDFILTAKSKGLNERRVLYRHALRNAMLPVVTVIGINFAYVMAGSVFTETVFGWPGMGRLIFESITARDYPMILGIFLVVSMMIVLANLITDILYAMIDPRVAYN